jgi:hypothetical protein
MGEKLCFVKWDGNVVHGFVVSGACVKADQVCEYNLTTKQMDKFSVGVVKGINTSYSDVSFFPHTASITV